jgi:hypothetical protein
MSQFARTALLQPVLGFVTLCSLIGVFSLAHTRHLIEVADWQRTLGQIVSLMLLVMGNFLPKLRPLQGSRIERGAAAAAERFAGRALFLAGLISFAWFIGLPPSEARVAAAWLGVGTCTMITVHWSWLTWSATAHDARETHSVSTLDVRTVRTGIWLLFGYAYICGSVWALDLLSGPARETTRTWLVTGFSMLISVVFPWVEAYPRRCRDAQVRAE